jgi:cytochrome P450
MGLITPKRLKENEDFMWRLADRLIDEFIKDGSMEIFSQFAQPYATLVIADLLGVPEEDHKEFRKAFQGQGGTGAIDKPPATDEDFPLYLIADRFFPYIEERRRNPRKDVLTDLARVKYPDGSLPPTRDVVDLSTFLFGAGQETTVRVIGSMLRILGDDPALQKRLRAERSLIPNFVEEALRMEGAVKSGFRLARVRAKIGDVEMEPGTPLMMCIGGMNRDPHKFENPNEFQVNRQNARDHMSFGRGIHSCIGAPLARAELKVTLERLFDRTADIRIDEAKHGSPGNRNYQYAASYIMRGLTELHLTFTPK